MVKCECGREAIYEVYEFNQPHCLECLKEAINCSVYVHVRRIDEFANKDQSKQRVRGPIRTQ
ncbi:hypothetical protein D3C72_2299310 [compost metagenome]